MARLILARCPNCSANLQVDPELEVATCTHCNASSFVQTSTRRAPSELIRQRGLVIDVKAKTWSAAWLLLGILPILLIGVGALAFSVSRLRAVTETAPSPSPVGTVVSESTVAPESTSAPRAEPPPAPVHEEVIAPVAPTQKPATSGGKAPRATVRMGATTVSGRLPPEVIQRIVRQNHGRFRMCYEQGLGRNPTLEGRLGVRFVIGRDGSVSNITRADSSFADPVVANCVMTGFAGLSFPKPESGIVTVVYPLIFSVTPA